MGQKTNFIKKVIEDQLRGYVLNVIETRTIPYDRTIFYTYGKNINIGGINFGELQSWYITMEIPKKFDIPTFAKEAKERVESYEREILANFPDIEGCDILCCELCDWKWLEGEDGNILRQSLIKPDTYEVVLVKYACCFSKKEIERLKDEAANVEVEREQERKGLEVFLKEIGVTASQLVSVLKAFVYDDDGSAENIDLPDWYLKEIGYFQ